MRRRDLVALLGGAVAGWPIPVSAEPTTGVRRVGVLTGDTAVTGSAALAQGLAAEGWVEGRNLRIEYHHAGTDRTLYATAATDLVGAEPDVILADTTVSLRALQQATRTIPIVFVRVSDPLGQGVIASIAHPGGNVTGFERRPFSMGGKVLELLREVAPPLARVAVLFNPDVATFAPTFLHEMESSAASMNLRVSANPVHDETEIDAAMAAQAHESGGGLAVLADQFTVANRKMIAELAIRHRLPEITFNHDDAAAGALLSYDADIIEQFRQAGSYLGRILSGAQPGDLPVQAPTKFRLVINLKTAKALGLSVPLIIQMTADEVIE